MDRAAAVTFAVAVFLFGCFGTVVALTGPIPTTNQVPVQTNSGVTITLSPGSLPSPFQPFNSDRELEVGGVEFSGANSAATVSDVSATANGRSWTNATSVSVQSSGELFIERPEASANRTGVQGTVDALRAAGNVGYRSGTQSVDIVATAGGSWTLMLNQTGLAKGTGVVAAESATGDALANGVVDGNGNVTIDGLGAVTNQRIDLTVGPSQLRLFQAEDPSQPAANAAVLVRFFEQGSEQVIETSTNNGVVSLLGAPKGKTITVTAQNDSQYVFRRTIIDSLTSQSEVYLIDEQNPNAISVEFRLEDRTAGKFPPTETNLLVERPIRKDFDGDGSNETRYQLVAGGSFGTGSYETTLLKNERYRLRVRNGANERVLGAYVAQGPDVETLRTGQVDLAVPSDAGFAVSLRDLREDIDNDNVEEQLVRVVYRDPGNRTEQLQYNVTKPQSNTQVTQVTVGGPLGTHQNTIEVNASAENTTYILNYEIVRENESGVDISRSGEKFAGKVPPFATRFPIDPFWRSIIGYVAILSVSGLVVIVSPALGALAGVMSASLLTVIGVVSVPTPALALAGAIAVFAVAGRATV